MFNIYSVTKTVTFFYKQVAIINVIKPISMLIPIIKSGYFHIVSRPVQILSNQKCRLSGLIKARQKFFVTIPTHLKLWPALRVASSVSQPQLRPFFIS